MVQPLDLGSTVPERLPIRIKRLEPGTGAEHDVVIHGYVYGPRCPGNVKAHIAAARSVLFSVRSEEVTPGQPLSPVEGAKLDEAYITYSREVIQALVPDLTWDEADMLAGDVERSDRLLEFLGLKSAAAPEGEAVAGVEKQTTGLSSPS